MAKQLSLAAALVMLAACAVPQKDEAVMWSTLDGEAPLVIAHRGASGYLPEHTLEAYKLAIDQGADVIEPDLVFTKDGVLVARHDRYLSTTTDVADRPEFAALKRGNADSADTPREDWWVEDFTLAELKTLRARQPFPRRSKAFDGLYEIPTFAEVLALASAEAAKSGREVGVYPETKHPGFFASIGLDFEKPLLTALAGFDSGPVFIQSFEPEILKRLKGKTDAKLVQLVYVATDVSEPDPMQPNIPLADLVPYVDGVGAEKRLRGFSTLYDESARSGFVDEAHRLGLFVHFWTYRDDQPDGGDAQMFSEMGDNADSRIPFLERITAAANTASDFELGLAYAYGVDGVFTDFPDTAVRVRETFFAPDRRAGSQVDE